MLALALALAAVPQRTMTIPLYRVTQLVFASKDVCAVKDDQLRSEAIRGATRNATERVIMSGLCVSYWAGRKDALDEAVSIVDQATR